MDAYSFGEHALRRFDAEISAVEQHIINGTPQDYQQYKVMTAKRDALIGCRAIIVDLIKNL